MWRRRVVDHEFFLQPNTSEAGKFKVDAGISDDVFSEFCEHVDFLSLPRLLKGLTPEDHEANARKAIAKMNLLSLEARGGRFAKNCGCDSNSVRSTPLIWDTGASYGLTPFRSDFIDYQECDIPVKDITKVNRVIGIGTVMYRFIATNGDVLYLPSLAYHLVTADIRLFSPQTYHQLYGGRSEIDGNKVLMKLQKQNDFTLRHDIQIDIDKQYTNLPVVYDVYGRCGIN